MNQTAQNKPTNLSHLILRLLHSKMGSPRKTARKMTEKKKSFQKDKIERGNGSRRSETECITKGQGNHQCNSKLAFAASSWVDFAAPNHRLLIHQYHKSRDRAVTRPSYAKVHPLEESGANTAARKNSQRVQATMIGRSLMKTGAGRGVTDG